MREHFADFITSGGVSFKHARGESVERGREFHTHHEIIYFLGGDAVFISERIHIALEPGMIAIIPKDTYHRVVVDGDSYHRALFHFSSGYPEELEPLFASPTVVRETESARAILNRLTEYAERGGGAAILPHALVMLLDELSRVAKESAEVHSAAVREAIKFVSENCEKKISVVDVAAACKISESSIAHVFKNEMNISLYRYIIQKRLATAHMRIESGESATAVAYECGFGDYSGFYKQYKKTFGTPPSAAKPKVK